MRRKERDVVIFCSPCDATGFVFDPDGDPWTCPKCQGHGQFPATRRPRERKRSGEQATLNLSA